MVEPEDEFVQPDGQHDFNDDVDPIPGPLRLQREGPDYVEIDPNPGDPKPADQPTDRHTLVKDAMDWVEDFVQKKKTKASLGGSASHVTSADAPLLFIVPKDDAKLAAVAKEWKAVATGMPLTPDLLPEYIVAHIAGKYLDLNGNAARPARPRETGHFLTPDLHLYIGDEL